MRALHVASAAMIVSASIGLLTGCADNGSTVSQTLSTDNSVGHLAASHNATGVAPGFVQMFQDGLHAPSTGPDISNAKRIAVADLGGGAVEVFTRTYGLLKTITSDLNTPVGDWYDEHGRLYVAYGIGPNRSVDRLPSVTEYPQGSTSPSFTYSTGLIDPITVTTDASDNVYAGDYNFGGDGFINEYAQDSNTVLNTCSPGGSVVGIAVGRTGSVFVVYEDSIHSIGRIAVYKRGLAGCRKTVLSVTVASPRGMQIDNNRALVVCDQVNGVDVIPAPYTTITHTFTGYAEASYVALNKDNSLMFVADFHNAVVYVQNYPSGTLITTLGSSNGISDPSGVATYP